MDSFTAAQQPWLPDYLKAIKSDAVNAPLIKLAIEALNVEARFEECPRGLLENFCLISPGI